ncbi:DUF2306 domain-containing protein [Undibacterium sp. Di26W]|uniref:DUF2306 domain-containing protein n=1 Tax=Undibacterium sp. Di26W TaxID=3413035 RepID=UPI003BF19227
MATREVFARPQLVFFLVVGLLFMLVMVKVELPLLLGMNPQWEQKINAYRWCLHVHALAATLALLAAPIQFFPGFRNRHLQMHRVLGRLYAIAVAIAAPLAIYIALMHLAPAEKWPAVAQGCLWLGTTLAAVLTACKKQLIMHQIWITRSYALTLTFIVTRMLVDVLKMDINASFGGNANLIWVSSFMALVMADLLCISLQQGRQLEAV